MLICPLHSRNWNKKRAGADAHNTPYTHVSKKLDLWNSGTTSPKQIFIYDFGVIHLPTDCEGKDWYESRTTCVVSIETVARLQDSMPSEWTRPTVEFLHRELSGFLLPDTWPYNSPDLNSVRSMQECMYKKPIRDFAQPKQWLMEVYSLTSNRPLWKRWYISIGNDSGPESRLKDYTLTHAVTCDAMHCSNRHTVLNDSCFSQY